MADIDSDFNLRRRHPFGRFHLITNAFQSAVAARTLNSTQNISYGGSAGQKLDVFPAEAKASPVFVFIHGGYFRSLDKSQYRYIASRMFRNGYTTVLVNYDLAPKVSVSEIVRQNLAAFEWIRENVHKWNGNPDDITLCGHSVGAFLAAKILEQDWRGGSGIKKAALLSGLYDLEPMRQSYLNKDARLTEGDVAALNPMAGTLKQKPDLLIAVGEEETGQFVTQSETYSADLNRAGIQNDLFVLPAINHYTMSRLLAGRKNAVMDWIRAPVSDQAVAAK